MTDQLAPSLNRRLVLLDYDGVIVDSLQTFVQAVNVAGHALGEDVSFTESDLRTLFPMSTAGIVNTAGIDPILSREFIKLLDEELMRRAPEMKMFPRMAEVIERISETMTLGIVSATPGNIIQAVLAGHGLEDRFSDVAGGEMPGSKAERICAIAERRQVALTDTWMVGDTVSDIRQGQEAGCLTMSVAWGWHSRSWLADASPDCEAEEPWDIVRQVLARA